MKGRYPDWGWCFTMAGGKKLYVGNRNFDAAYNQFAAWAVRQKEAPVLVRAEQKAIASESGEEAVSIGHRDSTGRLAGVVTVELPVTAARRLSDLLENEGRRKASPLCLFRQE